MMPLSQSISPSTEIEQLAAVMTPGSPSADLASVAQVFKILDDFLTRTTANDSESEVGRLLGRFDRPDLERGLLSDQSDLASALEAVRATLSDKAVQSAQQAIKTNEVNQKLASDQRLAKIKQAAEKINEAKGAGQVGQVFGWIAAGISVIASAVAVVLTLGAAAPVLALAVTGLVLAVASTSLMVAMQAAPEQMTKMFGSSDQNKKDAQIALMVTMIVLSVASALCTCGATAVAKSAEIPGLLAKYGYLVSGISGVGSGIASIAGGSANLVAGEARYQGSKAHALAIKIQAFILSLEHSTDANMDEIKDVLATWNESTTAVAAIIEDEMSTKNAIVKGIQSHA